MAVAIVCRICCSTVQRTHCTNFFSADSRKCDLAVRMSKLLLVSITEDDGISQFVCRGCKGKFTTIENKISSMQATAKSSYMKLQQNIAPRKRPKNTSGTDEEVSPHTARSRPSAKRTTGNRRLFPLGTGISQQTNLQQQN